MDLQLSGRAYLVTGASRGIGRAIAAALLSEGAAVLITGRDPVTLARTAEELGPRGADRLATMVADNGDPDAAERVVADLQRRFGRCDGAAISVGGPGAGGPLSVTDADWRQAFESVLLGAVRLSRAVVAVADPGAALLFVLSASVRQPLSGLAISNGLRPGLAMYAKSLADEVGPRGIRVNSLLPGKIDTDRIRELDGLADDPVAHRAAAEQAIPLRRYGDPAEVGRVGAFLLSPAASYLTGVALPVDGGLIRAL
jgi:3-oxoacyl-[acyl-carrier protein] reductase